LEPGLYLGAERLLVLRIHPAPVAIGSRRVGKSEQTPAWIYTILVGVGEKLERVADTRAQGYDKRLGDTGEFWREHLAYVAEQGWTLR
jgi:hypothetical protein